MKMSEDDRDTLFVTSLVIMFHTISEMSEDHRLMVIEWAKKKLDQFVMMEYSLQEMGNLSNDFMEKRHEQR